MTTLSNEEMRKMALRLETYDAVFSQLWQLGVPELTEEVATAAVIFDPLGEKLQWKINPKFWEKQSDVKKDFIVCHEMMHVILEHGRRAKDALALNIEQQIINVTMDVVINEMLINRFGFSRSVIDPKKIYCWLDTVFKNPKNRIPNKNFEFYLNLMKKYVKFKIVILQSNCKGTSDTGGVVTNKGTIMDDHSKLPTGDTASKIAERIGSRLSNEEKDNFCRKIKDDDPNVTGINAGNKAGSFSKTMEKMKVKVKKRKWEALIKKCLKNCLSDGPEETWITDFNRRIQVIGKSKMIIPTEINGEGHDRNKVSAYFFLDTSGSCTGLASRFWKLAMSVPKDRFDLKLRCFDTRVYAVNEKDKKLYGFGGTRFNILEEHIQEEIRATNSRYPDLVVMVTDGYGNRIFPEKPERWHVLLTTNFIRHFRLGMNIHDLRHFE